MVTNVLEATWFHKALFFNIQAANNLIVLSREDAGAERIFQNNGVPLLLNMIETGKPEMILAAVRTLSGMCTGHKARVSMFLWIKNE